MKNHEENDCYRKKTSYKEYTKNVTENVICNKLFITKISNQEHDSKTFIADSGATPHMVNSEENMTNLNNAETQVAVRDRRTLTGVNVEIGMATRDMT